MRRNWEEPETAIGTLEIKPANGRAVSGRYPVFVYSCPVCCALVADRDEHHAWHVRVGDDV